MRREGKERQKAGRPFPCRRPAARESLRESQQESQQENQLRSQCTENLHRVGRGQGRHIRVGVGAGCPGLSSCPGKAGGWVGAWHAVLGTTVPLSVQAAPDSLEAEDHLHISSATVNSVAVLCACMVYRICIAALLCFYLCTYCEISNTATLLCTVTCVHMFAPQ